MSGIKHIEGYDIMMKKVLGRGSFGDVYVGVKQNTKEQVAVKVLKKKQIDSDEYLKSALMNQIKIMQDIKSENVVGFHDVMESSNNYYIIQELCDGDLSALMKPGHPVSEKKAIQYLLQISNGFLALVKEGIVHRDLKPANVMTKNKVLKIGDFGFAKKVQGSSIKKQTIVGTPLYMSLQILKSEAYSSKCDIWALGFIFYEMLHGKTPWIGNSEYDLIKKIQTKPLQIDSSFSKNTIDFLRKALTLKDSDRMSWDQLFSHPIFQGYFTDTNKGQVFQNKLKMVMSDLRFHINSNNLDLCIILNGLGYKGNEELDKNKFHQFLRIVSPKIKREESQYIFQRVDTDKNGAVSISQIQNLMADNNISIKSIFQQMPGVRRTETMNSNSSTDVGSDLTMSSSTEKKVRQCFNKLLYILRAQGKLLFDVFKIFDKSKSDSLNRVQFKNMLKYLSTEISDEQINAAFNHIDIKNTGTIEFDELNKYFSRVNGIPEHLNKPHDPESSVGNVGGFFQQMMNPGYVPQYNYNPYQQNYPQQPNYNQGMYYQPPPPNFYNPNPFGRPPSNLNQPQPHVFNNPIMDQISQNMGNMRNMGNMGNQPYQNQNNNNKGGW